MRHNVRKTVLITGCSSGFGMVTAKLFSERGWNVAATMRRIDDGQELAALDNTLVARLDVEDAASIDQAIAATIDRFGGIDTVVNNAGFGLFGLFEAISEEKIVEQFQVNVFGVMRVTRAILPHFRARGRGTIVNISSGAGVFTIPMLSLYCASKFALEGFSEGISYELASQGIAVKIVEPGGVLGTNFGKRSGTEAGQNASLQGYDAFVAGTGEIFEALRAAATASAADVAKVIFEAATDDTDRLRYVATDDIAPIIEARRQTSEPDYIAFMRSHFTPKL
jgi:NAD(P)-dependent dehydrogenase (short-subunit alcohol dehydrogenase family)